MTVGAAKHGGYAYSAVSIRRGLGNAQKSPRHKCHAVATRLPAVTLSNPSKGPQASLPPLVQS